MSSATAGSADVVTFWREAGPDKWFAKDPEFDRLFRERFLDLHMLIAARGRDEWMTSAEGCLALILLACAPTAEEVRFLADGGFAG
ncbi:MAG: DUF924 family protein [Acetobacteraceae bacterium]